MSTEIPSFKSISSYVRVDLFSSKLLFPQDSSLTIYNRSIS